MSFFFFVSFREEKGSTAKEGSLDQLAARPAGRSCLGYCTVFAYRARVCDLCELPACVRACVRAHVRLLVLLFFLLFVFQNPSPPSLSFFQISSDCSPRQQHGGTHTGERSTDGVADILGHYCIVRPLTYV